MPRKPAFKGRVIIRDSSGKFMSLRDRYSDDVAKIQVVRNKQYITVSDRPLPPEDLANILSQREFEGLPEALVDVDTYASTSKYKAWDIAEQIDETKGVRRKELKFTMTVMDGKRKREITFYHKIKRNQKSSYSLFRRMNSELGFEGFYLYNQVGSKMLADRKGKQVKLVGVRVQEIR